MADQSLSIGDLVRVIGPAATSIRDTFALAEDTKIVDVRYSDDHQALFACPIDGWGVVNFPASSLQLMRRGWQVDLETQGEDTGTCGRCGGPGPLNQQGMCWHCQ